MSDEKTDFQKWQEQSMAEFWERIEHVKANSPNGGIGDADSEPSPVSQLFSGLDGFWLASWKKSALYAVALALGVIGCANYQNDAAVCGCIMLSVALMAVGAIAGYEKKAATARTCALLVGELACWVFASTALTILSAKAAPAGPVTVLLLMLVGMAMWAMHFVRQLTALFADADVPLATKEPA